MTDLLLAIASFFSDSIEIIGQFSLSMYKFELLDGVKIVELNNTLLSSNLPKKSPSQQLKAKKQPKKLAVNTVWKMTATTTTFPRHDKNNCLNNLLVTKFSQCKFLFITHLMHYLFVWSPVFFVNLSLRFLWI